MSHSNFVASYKGRLHQSPLFAFEPSEKPQNVAPHVLDSALMLPTTPEQLFIARTVQTSVGSHITDMICPWDSDHCVEIKPVPSAESTSLPDAMFVEVDKHGRYELNLERMESDLRQFLRANIPVVLRFRQSDKAFSISSFEPQIPKTLEGVFFYDELHHHMGGKRIVHGAFTSHCGTHAHLPCKMMLATLTESGVFSQLTTGFRLDAKVKFECDEDGGGLMVTELDLPTYPGEFDAEIISATLVEKEKADANLLVCEFCYFEGLVSRVNITNRKWDVIAVSDSVSFKATLAFHPSENFKFTFLRLAMSTLVEAKVLPKTLKPYPSEFEFMCFGLVIRVSVTQEHWETFTRSKRQISYSGVSVPHFELNEPLTLPVTYGQRKTTKHTAWSPPVKFYLHRLSVPEVIKGTFSYVKSEYIQGHLYYMFRRGDVDIHYPVLAAEFFLYGIAGFDKNASIELRLEKYSRYNKSTQRAYYAKHSRGSRRNEWSVQEVISPLPLLPSQMKTGYLKAYSVMEWGRDEELDSLSHEYWEAFSSQRRNHAFCALMGVGPVYPLVSIPPILLHKNGFQRLKPGPKEKHMIEVLVGSESVDAKGSFPEWRWVKAVRPVLQAESARTPQVTSLTCIEQKVIVPKKRMAETGKDTCS
ncbi:hypothetical protein [Vibrio coralliilyticus]|uniref:hypothetical protein n=1 Tax=Vibrio coralliilyticus TaxID=190893 RepID=UPI00301C64A9